MIRTVLHIEIDDQPVKYTKTPPKRLAKGLFNGADIWAVSDPRVEILVQVKQLQNNSLWKYTFLPKQNVKLSFFQQIQSIYFLYNQGERLKIQLGSQAPVIYDQNQYNLFTMPKFHLMAYPEAGKRKFDLFLIDIGNGDPNCLRKVLADVNMLNKFPNI